MECLPRWFLWTMFFSFCTLWFLFRPCFSLQSPCGFYSDCVFSKCYTKGSTVMRALRLAIPLWFLSGPRFLGIAPWGFYKEWGFCYPPPAVFIQAVVLQKLPMMFLFCPCAQSSTIEYLIAGDIASAKFRRRRQPTVLSQMYTFSLLLTVAFCTHYFLLKSYVSELW